MSIAHAIPKPILQFNKEGILVKEYECIFDANIDTDISKCSIYNNLANLSKTAGGYKWEYKTVKLLQQSSMK